MAADGRKYCSPAVQNTMVFCIRKVSGPSGVTFQNQLRLTTQMPGDPPGLRGHRYRSQHHRERLRSSLRKCLTKPLLLRCRRSLTVEYLHLRNKQMTGHRSVSCHFYRKAPTIPSQRLCTTPAGYAPPQSGFAAHTSHNLRAKSSSKFGRICKK